MVRYAALLKEKLGVDVDKIPGAGAAGGLGAAFCVFLKANLKSGIDTVLDLVHFDSLLEGVDLVITGEGRMDWQSAFGKVVCPGKGRVLSRDGGGTGRDGKQRSLRAHFPTQKREKIVWIRSSRMLSLIHIYVYKRQSFSRVLGSRSICWR